jgi:hypothetical protein
MSLNYSVCQNSPSPIELTSVHCFGSKARKRKRPGHNQTVASISALWCERIPGPDPPSLFQNPKAIKGLK